jgi:DNA-binding NtrC family response regulator
MKNPKNELIYIVEDDQIYSSIVKAYLENKGYSNIEVFEDGPACLDNLYKMPKIILLDYQIGDINGIDVLRKVKAFDPDIPIVFLSGQKKIDVAVTSLKYGSIDYILKDHEAMGKINGLIDKILSSYMQTIKQRKASRLKKILFAAILIPVVFSLFLLF